MTCLIVYFYFQKKKKINLPFGCIRVRGQSDINFCVQYVIMMQTRQTPTLCHMYHSQNSPFLILCKLIVGWREGDIKRGMVFYVKSIDLEEVLNVGESRIHQCKVGIQTFKVELFCENCFGL